MRFLRLGLSDAVPDANTIWTFREALTRATIDGKPAIEVLFRSYEAALRVRLETHGWVVRRSRFPPIATRIMACETSIRAS